MTDRITDDELLETLRAVERGDDRLATLGPSFNSIYCGNVAYVVTEGPHAGWLLLVFNDCGEWDYVDSAQALDGRMIAFEEMDFNHAAAKWAPSAVERWASVPVINVDAYRERLDRLETYSANAYFREERQRADCIAQGRLSS